MPSYWLFKSDPETFSWNDLKKSPGKRTLWDGVRNYQARNMLRDQIRKGDQVLFYHSRETPPAVVGTATVMRDGYPDPTQFDPSSPGHDPRSRPEEPRWYGVDIRADSTLRRPVTLPELRETKGLEAMKLLQKGSRLSVQPVSKKEWNIVLKLAGSRVTR